MTIGSRDLRRPVHESWLEPLERCADVLNDLAAFLAEEERAGRPFAPETDRILRALSMPVSDVRVLILGQDPYPTAGYAVGWAFAVDRNASPIPASLRNIFAELETDQGVQRPITGHLTPWVQRGVLLLNRVLTVPIGDAGGHRRHGWEQVTAAVIEHLASTNSSFVAALWGRDAQQALPLLGDVPVVTAAHPSPLSAHRGFLGTRPFSAINRALEKRGSAPLDWSLDVDTPSSTSADSDLPRRR